MESEKQVAQLKIQSTSLLFQSSGTDKFRFKTTCADCTRDANDSLLSISTFTHFQGGCDIARPTESHRSHFASPHMRSRSLKIRCGTLPGPPLHRSRSPGRRCGTGRQMEKDCHQRSTRPYWNSAQLMTHGGDDSNDHPNHDQECNSCPRGNADDQNCVALGR
jgi:hypothetical protein